MRERFAYSGQLPLTLCHARAKGSLKSAGLSITIMSITITIKLGQQSYIKKAARVQQKKKKSNWVAVNKS